MTPTETAAILRQFNDWRRGDYPPEDQPTQPDPVEIGEAIDAAVELIERMGKMEAALQIALRQNSHDMLMTGDELRQCEAALMAKLEATEKERDFAKVEIARLHDDVRELTDVRVLDEEDRELWTTLKAKSAEKERDELRARIEEMENQEPVAWCSTDETGTVIEALGMNQSRRFDTPLYLAPGAQPAPSIRPAALSTVINWLRNGCDPMEAADELEVLAAGPGGQAMTDHAHELRRYARKIAHPAGDVPAVMRAAADEIERLQSVIAGLRADFETAHARMMTSAEREREACAALCDRFALRDMHPEECAAAIRARGEK